MSNNYCYLLMFKFGCQFSFFKHPKSNARNAREIGRICHVRTLQVSYLLFSKPGVYHKHNTVYSQWRLGNVGWYDAFSTYSSVRSTWWCCLKYPLQNWDMHKINSDILTVPNMKALSLTMLAGQAHKETTMVVSFEKYQGHLND